MATLDKLAYSPLEVSQLMGLSLGSVYLYLRDGRIPSVKLGRRILISRKSLEAILETGLPEGE